MPIIVPTTTAATIQIYQKKATHVTSERSSKVMKPIMKTSWERKMKDKVRLRRPRCVNWCGGTLAMTPSWATR